MRRYEKAMKQQHPLGLTVGTTSGAFQLSGRVIGRLVTIAVMIAAGISWSCGAGDNREITSDPRVEIKIRSDLPWQASGLELNAGETWALTAAGRYTFHSAGYDAGPEGLPDAVPFGGAWPASELTGLALIGRIGESGPPFLVGSSLELVADRSGMLFLRVNDDILEENGGDLTIIAEHER